MRVEVAVFATLRRFVPGMPVGGVRYLDVEPGATLADLMVRLGLPPEEVKIVMRNNRQAKLEDPVADGDRVAFIPVVAGG